MPHTIRLRGPWRYRALYPTIWTSAGSIAAQELADSDSSTELPTTQVCEIGQDWHSYLPGFYGVVRFERSFNKPSGLTSGESVWLVVTKVDAIGEVNLNGEPLGVIPPSCEQLEENAEGDWRIDITEHLKPGNVLQIDVDLPLEREDSPPLPRSRKGEGGGIIGEVRLEIYEG